MIRGRKGPLGPDGFGDGGFDLCEPPRIERDLRAGRTDCVFESSMDGVSVLESLGLLSEDVSHSGAPGAGKVADEGSGEGIEVHFLGLHEISNLSSGSFLPFEGSGLEGRISECLQEGQVGLPRDSREATVCR